MSQNIKPALRAKILIVKMHLILVKARVLHTIQQSALLCTTHTGVGRQDVLDSHLNTQIKKVTLSN